MACRNLCERLYSKIIVGKSRYELVRNTVEGVKFTHFTMAHFVRAAETALRVSLTARKANAAIIPTELILHKEEKKYAVVLQLQS